jgi:hypothetical protein
MSRRALITGAVGGIVGTAMAAFGIAWLFIQNTFQTEISNYLGELGSYFTDLFAPYLYSFTGSGAYAFSSPPLFFAIPYFPSWSLFGVSSFILTAFLVVTGILIGVGFYGTYKIGGGAMGVVGLVFGALGVPLGALLILMTNLTTGYEPIDIFFDVGEAGAWVPFAPLPTPNFPLIVLGFLILGLTFIVLGSASYSTRDMTNNPRVSSAAGILSIMGASVFIIGGVAFYFGGLLLAIGGFGLILVSFILWAVVFYSSRKM